MCIFTHSCMCQPNLLNKKKNMVTEKAEDVWGKDQEIRKL